MKLHRNYVFKMTKKFRQHFYLQNSSQSTAYNITRIWNNTFKCWLSTFTFSQINILVMENTRQNTWQFIVVWKIKCRSQVTLLSFWWWLCFHRLFPSWEKVGDHLWHVRHVWFGVKYIHLLLHFLKQTKKPNF